MNLYKYSPWDSALLGMSPINKDFYCIFLWTLLLSGRLIYQQIVEVFTLGEQFNEIVKG